MDNVRSAGQIQPPPRSFVRPTENLSNCAFSKIYYFQKKIFGVPHLATCIFLIFYNEPELGAEINPGMALTPLTSSIG